MPLSLSKPGQPKHETPPRESVAGFFHVRGGSPPSDACAIEMRYKKGIAKGVPKGQPNTGKWSKTRFPSHIGGLSRSTTFEHCKIGRWQAI